MRVPANGLEIEVETDGEGAGRPTVLLVMGLGMQLVAWPRALVDALVHAGFQVVRFDNRDMGRSTWLDHLGAPNMVWEFAKHKLGMPMAPPYTIQDMALDTLGVLDALGIAHAQVVGASMGGMVAQRVALAAPERVASLCSLMSSSGAAGLPGPRFAAWQAMLSRPASHALPDVEAFYVRLFQAIGSPGHPMPEDELRARIREAAARGYHPVGTLRQVAAIAADTGRARELARLRLPTLVIHGEDDPLVPIACGEDCARRIPGACFERIAGMGHDLAPGVVQRLQALLLPFLKAHAG